MPNIADFKFNEDTWDLVIENNDLVAVTGLEAVRQNLRQRLGMFKGEWFLNLQKGVPYFQEIFKKDYSPSEVDAAFKITILNTPGVLELLDYNLELDNVTGKMNLSFKVRSYDGIIDYGPYTI